MTDVKHLGAMSGSLTLNIGADDQNMAGLISLSCNVILLRSFNVILFQCLQEDVLC